MQLGKEKVAPHYQRDFFITNLSMYTSKNTEISQGQSQPSYYSIVPADVRYDKKLSPNAKLLYGEITALCNKEGYCWASNAYFAELYDVANGTISEWVRQLKSCGYISYEIERNNLRKIFLVVMTEKTEEGYQEKLKGVSGKAEGGYKKKLRGVSGKAEHNSKYNTTKNIKVNISPDGDDITFVDETKPTKRKRKEKPEPTYNPLGAQIIKAFEEVNPASKRMYGNVQQRRACDELLEEYSLEEILQTINLLPMSNVTPFMPTITTPMHLRDKWSQLKSAMNKRQSEVIREKNKYPVADFS